MNNKEEIIFNDIKEMLVPMYPMVDISMDTYLEYGNGSCLNMSSLEIVQFIVELENKYNIIIDIDDRYYTVGDAVRGVTVYLHEKAGSSKEESGGPKL